VRPGVQQNPDPALKERSPHDRMRAVRFGSSDDRKPTGGTGTGTDRKERNEEKNQKPPDSVREQAVFSNREVQRPPR
jgi:hypothetical protein